MWASRITQEQLSSSLDSKPRAAIKSPLDWTNFNPQRSTRPNISFMRTALNKLLEQTDADAMHHANKLRKKAIAVDNFQAGEL